MQIGAVRKLPHINSGPVKLTLLTNGSDERCAANKQWRFQCDDGRRIAIKTALNRRIEDGRERPEDEVTGCRS
ncbi:hypothetical protein T05_9676 [Trichinella murrelli]|uniref:Uncharacterized protein n=1 Tax=Trichinella murrelli TaxID=144512 RepID=A0A0V0SYN2_9BILA|nr:hypothetical protein T05_2532 [Trichinella murrelli]KRX32092.1 hypothetical protein T05_9676 [Trichinella murrelli]